jgi:hypothetical protein
MPFLTFFLRRHLKFIKLASFHDWAQKQKHGSHLHKTLPYFTYHLQYFVPTTFWIWLRLPDPLVENLFHCVCTHSINWLVNIHLLQCAHGNEHMKTHDVVQVVITSTIVRKTNFKVVYEQLHMFTSFT